MSYGAQIAIALFMLTSGTAGYERYKHEGKNGAAMFDALMAMAAAVWLAVTIDKVLANG